MPMMSNGTQGKNIFPTTNASSTLELTIKHFAPGTYIIKICRWYYHEQHDLALKDVLEPSQQGTYVTYPYLGFQDYRELGHSRYIQYLITTTPHM
jgi:hypothetical protein